MDKTLLVALDERDVEAARRFIQDEADPLRVLAMYHGALRHLYWSAKDLATLVALGRHAIAFGIGAGRFDALKPVVYDIGSFCWPAWDEPGIEVTPEALMLGTESAALNLMLAMQLQRPASAFAHAHWLVGAYDLVAGRTADAARAFERSRTFAAEAGDRATALLATGYLAIARREDIDEAAFACVDDGADLVSQLRTAERYVWS